jgi:hypothetical protein
MYSNSVFAKHFNELLSGGVHILGTVLSQERRLQVAEIYGASLSENGGILRFLLSQNHWPDFYKALMNKQDIAVVFSSPMTMLTYQIKGQLIAINSIEEKDNSLFLFWKENYFQCIRQIGISQLTLENLNYKIDYAIDVQLTQVFLQTPQKGTGGILGS